MGKRSSKKQNGLIGLVLLVIGVAAAAMIFLPGLSIPDSETTYTGLMASFGGQLVDGSIFEIKLGEVKMNFNILGALAFILPVIAGLCIAFAGKNKILKLVGAVLFIGAAVLAFLLPSTSSITTEILGNATVSTPDWSLGIGAIISGALSGVGALGSLYLIVK